MPHADDSDDEPPILDPVCGEAVNPQQTGQAYFHGDRVFHFCSVGCLKRFVREPAQFVDVEDAIDA